MSSGFNPPFWRTRIVGVKAVVSTVLTLGRTHALGSSSKQYLA
ncbi:hypothetical protein AVDCRST_MAG94-4467 [uncultured Leptolyngbya sp.]|uniref:Uncharacterized protein n=1 Tax=uncultured Leptolyngbya sp. TaxID=332963 RepID=A0A6J4N1H2_9CYAN|nr:hypothetical protein AVDCRST_MAG94-4467 [uncultured Leptolyngbya sp.]